VPHVDGVVAVRGSSLPIRQPLRRVAWTGTTGAGGASSTVMSGARPAPVEPERTLGDLKSGWPRKKASVRCPHRRSTCPRGSSRVMVNVTLADRFRLAVGQLDRTPSGRGSRACSLHNHSVPAIWRGPFGARKAHRSSVTGTRNQSHPAADRIPAPKVAGEARSDGRSAGRSANRAASTQTVQPAFDCIPNSGTEAASTVVNRV